MFYKIQCKLVLVPKVLTYSKAMDNFVLYFHFSGLLVLGNYYKMMIGLFPHIEIFIYFFFVFCEYVSFTWYFKHRC